MWSLVSELVIGDRGLLTTSCAHVSKVNNTWSLRNLNSRYRRGKQSMFRCQLSLPPLHRPGCHTLYLLLTPIWCSSAHLIVPDDSAQVCDCLLLSPLCHEELRHLSRSHGCDVWQYALHCDNGCNPPHNVFCCGSTWRLATTTISSAPKLTNNKLFQDCLNSVAFGSNAIVC